MRRRHALPPLLAQPLLLLALLPPLALSEGAVRGGGTPIAPTKVAVVSAEACAAGQAQRPCTTVERITGGRTGSSTCPCPYIDGVSGGPGPVRRYTLDIRNAVLPSLVPSLNKVHVTINGTIPGPRIVANAGEWLEITVVNSLPNEPTILHWHGQLQVMTPFQDGVPSITQCVIQPGDSLVYAFRASNAGTFWYHGHHLDQYSDGLFGVLQVLPAPGSPEDLAKGLALGAADNEVFLTLSDYYNNNAHELLTLFYISPASEGLEPVPDAIQVNGKHKGQLFMDVHRAGKTLVHVVCASTFSMFRVSIDGVNLQLVEVDSTAILPLTVPSISINVGQRMSFIVDWSTLALPLTAKGVFLRVSARTDKYDRDPAGYVPPYEANLFQNPPLPLDPHFTGVFQFSPIAADGSGTRLPDYAAGGPNVPVAPAIAVPASGPYVGLDTRSAGRLDANLLDAVPAVKLSMPPGTHQLYVTCALRAVGAVQPSAFARSALLTGILSSFPPAQVPRGDLRRRPGVGGRARLL